MSLNQTNEENQVDVYSSMRASIKSNAVTHETPVEDLNLNWTEKELPEGARTKHVHRLHPYLGKFIPQLVEVFLRKYFSTGQTILDPFAGSGTTLVQANELGINSIGFDISAFNVLLCQAKTEHYDLKLAQWEIEDVLARTRQLTQLRLNELPLFANIADENGDFQSENSYLNTWFAPQALHELTSYRDIVQATNYRYKPLLQVIMCRAARSARLTTHFDLDFPKIPQSEPYWCYKHSRTCVPTTGAFKFLKRYSLDTIKRIKEFSALQTDATVDIRHADSREAVIPFVDGVISSPPYVGLIDYHEQHAYAYHLLGLEDRRSKEIGPATNGSSRKAQAKYSQDITAVFRVALSSMQPGGRVIVIAGDKFGLYDQIASELGIEVEDVIERHVNRRTGRRSGEFYESVFIWRKP